jgi:hypothetical protein
MKKHLLFFLLLIYSFFIFSQTGTTFWFAPPNVTDLHRPSEITDYYINITSLDQAATVHIWQPANPSGLDTTINLSANSSDKVYIGDHTADLETKPSNTVLNTGLLIESTTTISAYYEYDNYNNPDIFALKGANALGTEFYIPMHNYSGFPNHDYSTSDFDDMAYSAFDIVATEDNTTVRIYPSRDVDGHSGQQQFTVVLNKG